MGPPLFFWAFFFAGAFFLTFLPFGPASPSSCSAAAFGTSFGPDMGEGSGGAWTTGSCGEMTTGPGRGWAAASVCTAGPDLTLAVPTGAECEPISVGKAPGRTGAGPDDTAGGGFAAGAKLCAPGGGGAANTGASGEGTGMFGALGASSGAGGGPGGRIPTTGYGMGVGDRVPAGEPCSVRATAPWGLPGKAARGGPGPTAGDPGRELPISMAGGGPGAASPERTLMSSSARCCSDGGPWGETPGPAPPAAGRDGRAASAAAFRARAIATSRASSVRLSCSSSVTIAPRSR